MAHFLSTKWAVVGLILAISGCELTDSFMNSAQETSDARRADVGVIQDCREPRPTICTLRYNPVCAGMESGAITTYPSACNACADVAVSGWQPNACEE